MTSSGASIARELKLETDIHEIFASFQGEGTHIGEPMLFVRFARCDLACQYCDTPPVENPARMTLESVLAEIKSLDERFGPHRFVSLTGGEPLRYTSFLKKFLPALLSAGFQTYLESDGTKPVQLQEVIEWVDLVAMDIKLPSATGMRTFWQEHQAYLEAAGDTGLFVKVVVVGSTPAQEVAQAAQLVARWRPSTPFIIQPATAFGRFSDVPNAEKIMEAVQAARTQLDDVRVIGQTHKLIGVR